MVPSAEEILSSLVHDLRQPLGNIETSIFYLDLVLEHPQGRVGDQLRTVELQVAQAARLLQEAAAELHRLRVQRGVAEGAAALTNSATAAVT